MNTNLNTSALALAVALVGAALNAVCFSVYLAVGRPDPWMELFIGSGPSPVGWLIGITEGAGVGGFIGGLTALLYNRFSRPAPSSR